MVVPVRWVAPPGEQRRVVEQRRRVVVSERQVVEQRRRVVEPPLEPWDGNRVGEQS